MISNLHAEYPDAFFLDPELFHAVFGTSKRQPMIGADWHERLYAFIGGICRDLGAQLIAGNGMEDHAHLLVRYPPDLAHAVLLREVKARSSRWIHETFAEQQSFAWQRGYGGFTVSKSNVPEVEQYIREQAAHHRFMSFEDEFLALLRKHEVEFDPRYVFE